MKNKVLFLDIDGVLNSEAWFSGPDNTPGQLGKLDPEACALLEQVIQRTGCKLVLSSSWRYSISPLAIESLLEERGTESACFLESTGPDLSTRDDEILLWTKTHPVSEWAAIDDTSLPTIAKLGRFVRTEFATGMTQEHVDALVRILGEIST